MNFQTWLPEQVVQQFPLKRIVSGHWGRLSDWPSQSWPKNKESLQMLRHITRKALSDHHFSTLATLVFLLFTYSLTANASTIVVTSTNNSGAGTLRQAIFD